MPEEKFLEKSADFLLTKSTIEKNVSLDDLVKRLRPRRTTGEIIVRLLEGGVASVHVTETTKTTDHQSDQIREILNME
jgi:hypothetical protein